jgi:hypothetical protein
MLELENYQKSIKEFVTLSIQSFGNESRSIKVSCMAIYCSPSGGWISMNFDTEIHSSQHVAEFKKYGYEWYGEDNKGKYCNNCADFEFAGYNTIQFPEWVQEYETEDFPTIKQVNADIKQINLELEGDEALNEVFFQFLKEILKDLGENSVLVQLNSETLFRIGVLMVDSEYCEFWPISS